jgi:SAM-dependent methyltransferase
MPTPRRIATRWLGNPLTRGLSIDDPRTTGLRREIIRKKSFLRKIYEEWYRSVAAAVPGGTEPALEIGSGAGFLEEFVPNLITSEIFLCPGVKLVLDGQYLPFRDSTLRAVVMVDVLHHIPKPRLLLAEAARCVKPGGVFVAIEPWATPWAKWVHTQLHYEPIDPEAREWEIPAQGPLSGANNAMPWIIFHRDREQFEREFPEWEIASIRPCMPVRYILSGGVRLRSVMPGFTFGLWRTIESALNPWRERLAMFAQIVLKRRS